MPNFSAVKGGLYAASLSNGNLEIDVLNWRYPAELDKTQVTELVSFLQKWLEEQNNGSGAQDL